MEEDLKQNTFVTQSDINQGTTTKSLGEELSKEEVDEKIRDLNLQKKLDVARNRLFLNQLSAQFALNALQSYLLPLFYGLLGALVYVLRTLSNEIKNVTYSSHSEIRFRLRLSLGSLGGMVIGWFFTPESGSSLASLGPMTIAFLTGYNIDILFSLMDKIANSITDSVKGGAPKPPSAPAEKPKSAGAAPAAPSSPAASKSDETPPPQITRKKRPSPSSEEDKT